MPPGNMDGHQAQGVCRRNKKMSDDFDEKKEDAEEESFAELFESYTKGMNEDLQVGDKVRGTILSIGIDTIFVDTGSKIDGAVEKSELLDENGELPYKQGDTLELYVVVLNENEMVLSKAISGIGGINLIRDSFEGNIPIEGTVFETCKGGFRVDVMQRKAFCPISQIDSIFVEKPEDYIGEKFLFFITLLEEDGRNIVVSRRKYLEAEQKKAARKFYSEVKTGTVFDCRVSRLMPYGAFVELVDHIEGMIHISELSWSRIEKPEQVVAVGDSIRARIISIEKDEKSGKMKMALSAKQVLEDPWDSVDQQFKAGDKLKGRVTRCMNFGAFVEIAPGIEGLVHISEMSYVKRILKTEDVVSPGDAVNVLIKEIDMDKKRISLSIRDAEGDPWVGIQEKYTVGQTLGGTIEKKERFGYFIMLEPGITGLLPKSKISRSYNPAGIEKLREGDSITVVVHDIDSDQRRITLDPGDSTDNDKWKEYAPGDSKTLGALGEKLKLALKTKNDLDLES